MSPPLPLPVADPPEPEEVFVREEPMLVVPAVPEPMFIVPIAPEPVNHATRGLRNTRAIRSSTPIITADTVRVRRCSRRFACDPGVAPDVEPDPEAAEVEPSFELVIVHLQECGLRVGRARPAGDPARRACARSRARRRAARARP